MVFGGSVTLPRNSKVAFCGSAATPDAGVRKHRSIGANRKTGRFGVFLGSFIRGIVAPEERPSHTCVRVWDGSVSGGTGLQPVLYGQAGMPALPERPRT